MSAVGQPAANPSVICPVCPTYAHKPSKDAVMVEEHDSVGCIMPNSYFSPLFRFQSLVHCFHGGVGVVAGDPDPGIHI